MKKIAAFFDFDETLITTHTSKLMNTYMRDNKLRSFCGKRLSILYFLNTILFKLLNIIRIIDYEKLNQVLYEFWKGRSRDMVHEWMKDFYPEYIEKSLAPALLNKLKEHRDRGHVLVLVSAGIQDMLQSVTQNLCFDYCISTELEVDGKGFYTGNFLGAPCIGKNKQTRAQQIAEKLHIDMKNSYSYGNHHNDIPVLEMVGNPHAVEPTRELLQTAKMRGWPVVSFY